MNVFIVLHDGSVSTITKSFDEAKQYVYQEELGDACCGNWTEEDFKRFAEGFNREAFVNGSAEYLDWWRIEKAELPFDVASWIRSYPEEEATARFVDKITRYKSFCDCIAGQEGTIT